jgi:hypothetical protein
MDQVITILIIIAAIVSFLNKVFRQQKEAQKKSTQPPVAKPKPGEWQPPWFEDNEPEQEFSLFDEEKTPVLQTASEPVEQKPAEITTENVQPVLVDYKDDLPSDDSQTSTIESSGFRINLNTPNDIRQGIVLAEILGPCKANRKRITS